MARVRGFTLIELLIVVAIIAILAAITAANFLSAQVRAKLAATREDFRNLATVFESYFTDFGTYPHGAATNPLGHRVYAAFTTPVSYSAEFTKMATERFHRDTDGTVAQIYYDVMFGRIDRKGFGGNNRPEIFRDIPRDCWLIDSLGPDGRDNVPDTPEYPREPRVFLPYDPSNGLMSTGDLYRPGGGYTPSWLRRYGK